MDAKLRAAKLARPIERHRIPQKERWSTHKERWSTHKERLSRIVTLALPIYRKTIDSVLKLKYQCKRRKAVPPLQRIE